MHKLLFRPPVNRIFSSTLRGEKWVPGCLSLALLCGTPVFASGTPTNPFYPAIEGLIEVQSLDVTAAKELIHALFVGRFAQRAGKAVAYAYSLDGGSSWTRPVFVSSPEGPAPISRRGNDAQLAVWKQHLMAVWQVEGQWPGTGPMAVALSRDGGRTWHGGTTPATGDTRHDQAHMALSADSSGEFHLAWLDDREENGNTQGLRYAKSDDGGRRWLPETTLDAATCTCCWNQLVVFPDQSIGVLYRDSDPHDMRLALRPRGSGQWRDSGAVGDFGWKFSGCPHCGGALTATGPQHEMAWHSVVWTGKEGVAGLYYLRSTDAGGHWSEPFHVGDGHSQQSDIASLPGGRLGLAFVATGADGASVYFRKSRDAGATWSDPTALTVPRASASHPYVVGTAFGFRVFWTETADRGAKTWAMAVPDA